MIQNRRKSIYLLLGSKHIARARTQYAPEPRDAMCIIKWGPSRAAIFHGIFIEIYFFIQIDYTDKIICSGAQLRVHSEPANVKWERKEGKQQQAHYVYARTNDRNSSEIFVPHACARRLIFRFNIFDIWNCSVIPPTASNVMFYCRIFDHRAPSSSHINLDKFCEWPIVIRARMIHAETIELKIWMEDAHAEIIHGQIQPMCRFDAIESRSECLRQSDFPRKIA